MKGTNIKDCRLLPTLIWTIKEKFHILTKFNFKKKHFYFFFTSGRQYLKGC